MPRLCLPLACLLILSLTSCRQSPPEARIYQRTQLLMGTVVQIKVVHTDAQAAEQAIQAALDEIKRVEREFDHRRPDSPISQVNRTAGREQIAVPSEFARLVQQSQKISELTGGSFDISIGPLSALWGFDSSPKKPPDPGQVIQTLKKVGYRKIKSQLDPPRAGLEESGMQLDFGAIAQGYMADQAFKALTNRGIKSMIVDTSGELRVAGSKPGGKPWVIGIQHPRQPDKVIATINMDKGAVVTSGDYERLFMYQGQRYHHILDPRTGYPAMACQSVSIWAPDAATADALATGMFVMGPAAGMQLIEKLPEIEGLIIAGNGKKFISSGLQGRLQIML